MSRQTKTSQQRAQEALDVAQRRVDKLDKAVDHQDELMRKTRAERQDAVKRRDYLALDPALPKDSDYLGGETPAARDEREHGETA